MKKYKIIQPLPQFGENAARVIEVPYELVKEIRADAFDEFFNALADELTWLMGFGEEVYISVGDNARMIAEQLKAGEMK